jgi:GNAT superfamily N-acetyltransferase
MISVRPAVEGDIEAICTFDLIARQEVKRREFIRREVASRNCFVAVVEEAIIGYGVLNYGFYDNGWIDMLYVHADHRRCSVSTALMRHMESLCQTPKLFTSTNLSNLPMHSLLTKSGYLISGIIHNLDEDDPEIVYFKRLK